MASAKTTAVPIAPAGFVADGPAASRRTPAPARSGTRSRRSARSRARSPWARSGCPGRRARRAHRAATGSRTRSRTTPRRSTPSVPVTVTSTRSPIGQPVRVELGHPVHLGALVIGPADRHRGAAVGVDLVHQHAQHATDSLLGALRDQLVGQIGDPGPALLDQVDGQMMIEPNGLGALLVGVAEDADRVQSGPPPGSRRAPGRRPRSRRGTRRSRCSGCRPRAPGVRTWSTRARNESASPNRRIRRSTGPTRAGTTGRSTAPRPGSSR